MQRLLYVGVATGLVVACFLGWFAWQYGAAIFDRGTAKSFSANPEDGTIASGSYTSEYFRLSYRLPQGFVAGEAGPGPSQSGYYVLATSITQQSGLANILIAAQDMFFGTDTKDNLADTVRDFQQAVSHVAGMAIDRDETEVKVASHVLYRVDYSGVGLFRARLATELRCHTVSFNLTTRDRDLLQRLADNLGNNLSFAASQDASLMPPPCVKGYAVDANVLHKVPPLPVGPYFAPVPVRIIVGADGSVKHVHVIHATANQRRSIEEALPQWTFKPYMIDGRPSPIETGVVFKFAGDAATASP
ncbi:MAG TPA: hypothetical protein VGJ20_27030 [Xanthobacteraceae bacterium]|jgi:hypothetical protein